MTTPNKKYQKFISGLAQKSMLKENNLIGHYRLRFNAPLIVAVLSGYIVWKYLTFSLIEVMASIIIVIGLVIWFSGLLAIKDSFSLDAKANKLITNGIYSKIGHPIYTGGIVVFIGWCVLIQSTWIYVFTTTLLVIEIVRANKEDKILLNKFGNEYLRYKASTWI